MSDQKDMAASVDQVLAPKTTAEQDRRTAGQRGINRTWENVQAILAISVVETTLVIVGILALKNDPSTTVAALAVLSGMVNLVIGFYFGRTNHARIGDDLKPIDDRK